MASWCQAASFAAYARHPGGGVVEMEEEMEREENGKEEEGKEVLSTPARTTAANLLR